MNEFREVGGVGAGVGPRVEVNTQQGSSCAVRSESVCLGDCYYISQA